jgi:primosomal protein N' (replication factor Y) (superfamily II helicase)
LCLFLISKKHANSRHTFGASVYKPFSPDGREIERRTSGKCTIFVIASSENGAPWIDCFSLFEQVNTPAMHKGRGRFAEVIIPSPLKEPLTYEVPADLQLKIGMRVVVPVGRRRVTGIVADFTDDSPVERLKAIVEVPDDRPVLDAASIRLAHWIAKYYLSSIGEVVTAMMPSHLRSESRRVVAAKAGEFAVEGLGRKILDELRRSKTPVALRSLARKFPRGGFYPALEALAGLGALEIRERARRRKKKKDSTSEPPAASELILTDEQQRAGEAIEESLGAGGFKPFLLYGVTGSGKTEVYLRAMERARRAGKQSLILVPEISLTPQLLDRLQARFPGRVGVLHSALTHGEHWEEWWRIIRGEVDVVVGARSAIFAPLPEIGLIVVDEEHDPSYKQEEGLRYNARDVAVVRAKFLDCPVILGSATPAIESYENCRGGRYTLLELKHRVERRPLPEVTTVDLRDAWSGETGGRPAERSKVPLLSPLLIEALRENLARNRQSLVFLNRRGFANFLQCRLCGFVLRCAHCSVTLTFHKRESIALCHHCGWRCAAPDACPHCHQAAFLPVGFGTEQLEQELSELFPEARSARMDRDTTVRRGSQERIIRQWERGEIDILMGTQMITKGHDVSGVTLVGAILADLSLNLPDFRAAERTFQLLSQVAGRAGRGNDPGRVIVQTYNPDHYALRHVLTHDYTGFFAAEVEFRRALNYPPFSRLVHLRLEGPKAREIEDKAKLLGEWLRDECRRHAPSYPDIEVLGPAPAPIMKLRGRFRWQMLLKGRQAPPLLALAAGAQARLPRTNRVRLHIDVDPYNML